MTRPSSEYRRAWRKDQHFGRPRTVDATGTRRRLQALSVQGWSLAELARRCGLSRCAFVHITSGNYPRVRKFVADRVAVLYEQLWNETPTGRQVVKVRSFALERGYAPAAAWDDIDDPNEHPKGCGSHVYLSSVKREAKMRKAA